MARFWRLENRINHLNKIAFVFHNPLFGIDISYQIRKAFIKVAIFLLLDIEAIRS
jgi:hypothetical protein